MVFSISGRQGETWTAPLPIIAIRAYEKCLSSLPPEEVNFGRDKDIIDRAKPIRETVASTAASATGKQHIVSSG
jgi:hypothetical protein